MNRLLWVVVVSCSACSITTPMQTASVVAPRTVRVGGQLSTAAFCGDAAGGGLGVLRCAEYPDGIPLPELRVSGRAGLGHGFDVGGSAYGLGQLFAPERAVTLGVTLDAKKEVARVRAGGVTHVLSGGLLFGASTAFRPGLEAWNQLEVGVPLFYGLQLARLEVVVGTTVSARSLHAPAPSPDLTLPRVLFSLGLFTREPTGLAVQVSYLTDPQRFTFGALSLQVGLFFDLLRP